MKRVKLVVAYDGTNYCGWQVQKNGETIESVLNRAIGELTGEEIHVMGSSRTFYLSFNIIKIAKKSLFFL